MSATIDARQVAVYLRWVHEHAITAGLDGRQVITAKVDDRWRSRVFTLSELDEAGQHAVDVNGAGWNTYYRTHLIDRDIPAHERGRGEYTSVVTHLTADIDIAGPGHKPPAGTTLAPTAEAAAAIADATLPPSLILNSGGGLYPDWRFTQPFFTTTDEQRARIKNIGRRLDRALNTCGHHVDATSLDLARVIRPPGVINHKPGRDPRPVTVWRGLVDGAGDYSIDELERRLPALPEPEPVKPRPPRNTTVTGAPPAWDIFAEKYTVDDVLAADSRHQWERVKDQQRMPAWRRIGSDSDYSIKLSPTGAIIVWSSVIAGELRIDPGSAVDLWGLACGLVRRDPSEAARAVKR